MSELLKLIISGLVVVITLTVAVRKKDPGCPT